MFFIRSVFLDTHGLRLQHLIFFSRIITPLVISRTYSDSSYSFCSYRTIADKNCIIWTRHFEQFDLNSLAWRNLNILPLILFTFAPCLVDWALVKVRTWHQCGKQSHFPHLFSYDYGKTIYGLCYVDTWKAQYFEAWT